MTTTAQALRRVLSIAAFLFALALFTFAPAGAARATVGDMGFFGGVSEGRKLPKTTELLLAQNARTRNRKARAPLAYKELIFLGGAPREFTGVLDVTANGGVTDTEDFGTYTETYRVSPGAASDRTATVSRVIVFNVNWRRENRQIIKDYAVRSWAEAITDGGASYVLDPAQSSFGISVIEDHTPGVVYYRGDVSSHAVYSGGTTSDSSGSFYGYSCAFSNTETHRLNVAVSGDGWQMLCQVRPSVSVSKTLQYAGNEPEAMSFAGNYKEVVQNSSGLRYDILANPWMYPDQKTSGEASIASQNTFEQLVAPDLSFLEGHPAADDIARLFAMEALTGDPKRFEPSQAITRGQYVTALVRAIKLPVEAPAAKSPRGKAAPPAAVFPDVTPERPEYPYIMAAYRAGLANGRDNGRFYTDSPLERQEAVAVMVRALGLTAVAPDPAPATPFTDGGRIGGWARREVEAARSLGLIGPDADGRFRPREIFSKADAAALINRMAEYMRSGLATDYAEHIVDYPG